MAKEMDIYTHNVISFNHKENCTCETCSKIHKNRNVILNEVASSESQTPCFLSSSDFYAYICGGVNTGRSRGLQRGSCEGSKRTKGKSDGGGRR